MKKKLQHTTEKDTYSTPRWVKVSGIIAIVLVLLVVIMMFVSGGNHGPGRHLSSSTGVEEGMKQS
jgi:hypothetical protein